LTLLLLLSLPLCLRPASCRLGSRSGSLLNADSSKKPYSAYTCRQVQHQQAQTLAGAGAEGSRARQQQQRHLTLLLLLHA
jgi:hypothetical protein